MFKILRVLAVSFLSLVFSSPPGLAWSEKVHAYISVRAGMENPDYSNIPDFEREEAEDLLSAHHWHLAPPHLKVTPEYIGRFQLITIRCAGPSGETLKIDIPHPSGALYWRIIDLYRKMTESSGWRYDYYLFNISHLIADLSQPLHNYCRGEEPASDGLAYPEIGNWSRKHHREFDKILDLSLPPDTETARQITNAIRTIEITSEDDLRREVAETANSSIDLADRCYAERRVITKEEAVRQIARSISLLKAVLDSTSLNRDSPELFEMPN